MEGRYSKDMLHEMMSVGESLTNRAAACCLMPQFLVQRMLKPHEEVYNSSRYRFALLDGSMDGVSFRFFGADRLDFYDGKMTNWRITDCNMSEAAFYDTWMEGCRFYETGLDKSDFRHASLNNSTFHNSGFEKCALTACDVSGMTIDGINVKEALAFHRAGKMPEEKGH